MEQETQEMRLPLRARSFREFAWCSERLATVRAAAGMVVSVVDDIGKRRRWLLAESERLAAVERVGGGCVEPISPRDPRHRAVLGQRIGDRQMYQWGGRARAIRLERIEPGIGHPGRCRLP